MSDKKPSLDKINIKRLSKFKIGEPLLASKLNRPSEVLESLGSAKPPEEVRQFGSSIQLKMFKVIGLDTDIIKCFTWNGREKGEDEIKVALPYLLRITPFDKATRVDPPRAGITYEYSEFNLRLATKPAEDPEDDDDEEDQIIVDSYEKDDIIFAMKGIFGGTSLYHDDPDNKQAVVWLDTNVDGRFWALDDDPPEDE